MALSFEEVMQHMADRDPYHSNGNTSGQDVAAGERLLSYLRGMQLSPSDPGKEEDSEQCPDFNGMPAEEDDIKMAMTEASSGLGLIGYSRERLLAMGASSTPPPPPPGLRRKLGQYPAMRSKRTTEVEAAQQLPEMRKNRGRAKTEATLDLPVLPNGLAFTYDPVLGVWIPRSRPEDGKGV